MNVTPAWLRVVAYRLRQVRQQLGFVPSLSSQDKQEVQRWLPPSALPLFYTMSVADQQHSLRVCRGLQAQGCVEHDMLAAALLHDVGKAQGRVPFWTRPVIVLGKLCSPHLLAQVIVPLSQISVGTDLSRPRGGIGGNTSQEMHLRRDVAPPPPPSLDAINRSLPNIDNQKWYLRPVGAAIHCAQRWGWRGNRPYNISFARANPSPPIIGRNELPPLPHLEVNVHSWRRALSYAWWHAEVGAHLAADAGLSERAVLYIRTHHESHGPAAKLHCVDEVS